MCLSLFCLMDNMLDVCVAFAVVPFKLMDNMLGGFKGKPTGKMLLFKDTLVGVGVHGKQKKTDPC